eukprot:6362855-Prymnesium_polylepis.2
MNSPRGIRKLSPRRSRSPVRSDHGSVNAVSKENYSSRPAPRPSTPRDQRSRSRSPTCVHAVASAAASAAASSVGRSMSFGRRN